MRPKKLYITRHGESIGNVDWRNYFIYKDDELPLTAKGKIQANTLGLELNTIIKGPTAIISSHYKRAVDTALILGTCLGPNNVRQKQDHDLRELLWCRKDLKMDDFARTQQCANMGKFKHFNEGGESPYDVWKRQENVIDRLENDWYDDNYPENAVIVCHGIVMIVLVMRLCSIPQKSYESIATPHNCEYLELEPRGTTGWRLTTPLRSK